MTLKEFFRKARRAGHWGVTQEGYVLCAIGWCPLRLMAGVWSPREAARKLGLRLGMAQKIAHAADDSDDRNRKWLLKNLGVGSQESPK